MPARTFQGDSRLPATRGYAIPAPRTSGMLRTMLVLLVCVILFIPGYYIVTQVWKPSISFPQNISAPRLSLGEKPAVIKNAQLSSITDTGAIVTWETDKPTNAQVMVCDPSGFCTWTELQEPLVANHWIPLHDLKASTTYHLTLLSKDANGKEASLEKELTTLAQADTAPPTVTEVSVFRIEETSASITWVTNEPATSQVEYGISETYGKTSQLDEQLTTSHSVALTSLEPDALYHFKVKSTDAGGNEASSQDNTLKTQASLPIGPNVGNRAPDFTLQTIDGKEISLKSLRGKKVVLNFWATWCGPCVGEMPYFQDITRTWKADEVVILAINLEENTSTVRNFLAGERFTFTILLDTEGTAGKRYEVSSIPRTFFIDRDGVVRETKQGSFQNLAAIEELIRSL
jgi:peroxiredoxin